MIKDVPKNAGSILFIWWLTLNLGYFFRKMIKKSLDLDGPFVRRFSQYVERFFLPRWIGRFCFTRPGKLLHNYGKSLFLMGKSTISMAMFNSEL